jgi:hypothetical protein
MCTTDAHVVQLRDGSFRHFSPIFAVLTVFPSSQRRFSADLQQ